MSLKISDCVDTRLRKSLKLAASIKRGKSSKGRLLQELLRINGQKLKIDGDVGPITAGAVAKFTNDPKMKAAKTFDQKLIEALAQPMLRAVQPIAAKATLGETVVAIAKQHTEEHPIEVGGQNMGPWVRLYMDNNQGRDWPWCAGFVTYIVRAAARIHGFAMPVPRTYSCDVLGFDARKKDTLQYRGSAKTVPAGSIFLVRKTKNDWVHTGIVEEDDGDVFYTIEGNTNDEGHREGYEACYRLRDRDKLDVILI